MTVPNFTMRNYRWEVYVWNIINERFTLYSQGDFVGQSDNMKMVKIMATNRATFKSQQIPGKWSRIAERDDPNSADIKGEVYIKQDRSRSSVNKKTYIKLFVGKETSDKNIGDEIAHKLLMGENI